MKRLDLLPPPLSNYIGLEATVPVTGIQLPCIISRIDNVLKDHFWVTDREGYEHIVFAARDNIVFTAKIASPRVKISE